MSLEKRHSQIEELYKDLDQRKLVGIILELTIENINLKQKLSKQSIVNSLIEKKVPTFEEWKNTNYIHHGKGLFIRKAEALKDLDQLKKQYNEEIKY